MVPIEAHEVVDYAFGVSAISAPFLFGYYKTAPVTARCTWPPASEPSSPRCSLTIALTAAWGVAARPEAPRPWAKAAS